MPNMNSLFKLFRSIHPMAEDLRNHLEDIVKETKLERKGYLLKSGQVCENIYLIEKGLLRSFYVKNKKEISLRFMKEGEICVVYENFFKRRPGFEYIQDIEDTLTYYITYQELENIYTQFVTFNVTARILIERCQIFEKERLMAMWMQSAEDRYTWFAEKCPELMQRIPAKQIASYLGMTEVMCSNIKRRRDLPRQIN